MGNHESPEIYAWAPIQSCIYESIIKMYDRYMELILTAPIKEGSPGIQSMSQFINGLMVRGMIAFNDIIIPMEKELGLTENS